MTLTIQERPCTRCVKRGIGHLCHDEPRETGRKSKGDHGHTAAGEDEMSGNNIDSTDASVALDSQQGMINMNDRLLGIKADETS